MADTNIIFDTKTVTIDGKVVDLTKKQLQIFKCLHDNCNKPINRYEIIKNVWKTSANSDSMEYFIGRSMDVHISKLRKLINCKYCRIENVHGFGFMLIMDGFELEYLGEKYAIDNTSYTIDTKHVCMQKLASLPNRDIREIDTKKFIEIIITIQ